MVELKYLDEERNLIYHLEGNYTSLNRDNIEYLCSSCFKQFQHQKNALRHKNKCFLAFSEGINKIDSNAFKEVFDIINRFGKISQRVQGIDFLQTSENNIKLLNKITLVYVKDTRLLGFITFYLKEIKDKYFFSIEDFFVVEYTRKKGIGTFLFEDMLKRLNIDKNNVTEIEEKITVNSPSLELTSFLKKKGYNNTKCWC